MARKSLLRGDTLPLIRRLWRDWMRPHAKTLALVLVPLMLVAVFARRTAADSVELGRPSGVPALLGPGLAPPFGCGEEVGQPAPAAF